MSCLPALASEERHARHAHAVPAYRFDLDDLGTQVAEDHGAVGAGQVLAQVQHDNALQRPHQDAAPTAPIDDQGIYLFSAVPGLGQDLTGVFAHSWLRTLDSPGSPRQYGRDPHLRRGAQCGVHDGGRQTVGHELGM